MRRSIGGAGEIDLNQLIPAARLSLAPPRVPAPPSLAEDRASPPNAARSAATARRLGKAGYTYLRCVCWRMLGRGALWLNAAPRWCFTG